jgi:rRNA maturation RNase YbeY
LVNFFSEDIDFSLADEVFVESWINYTFLNEGLSFDSLNLIFCSDSFLLNINKTYLKHNYYTDVITFDLTEDTSFREGEIYISVDTVRNNALDLSISFDHEIYRVIIHGVLHLCGYNDQSREEIAIIRAKEDFYLARLF